MRPQLTLVRADRPLEHALRRPPPPLWRQVVGLVVLGVLAVVVAAVGILAMAAVLISWGGQ